MTTTTMFDHNSGQRQGAHGTVAALPQRRTPGALDTKRGMPDRASALSRAHAVIDRLKDCLDEETKALNSAIDVDLSALNNQKSHGLMELNSVLRSLAEGQADDSLRVRLAALRAKLDRNLTLIRRHLLAVTEVSTLVSEAIQNADSDGTYSPLARSAGARR